MPDVSVLHVLLHGKRIGTLTSVGRDATIFAFNEAYIDDEGRDTLSLSFKSRLGTLITDFAATRTSLLPFFSGLLPEGRLRKYLGEKAGVNPKREFYLLWALGQDLPGAVTIEPAEGEAWPVRFDDEEGEAAQERLRQQALRFSLAGVQLKFSAANADGKGLTIPAKGIGGSWIVKLPAREFAGVPENEFSMMTLAAHVGITVPPVRLLSVWEIENLPEGIEVFGEHVFAVERFDRLSDGTPVHIEDFAQVFDVYPDDKYDKGNCRMIASVLAAESGNGDVAELVRRITFNMLIGNGDMHLKNWSVIYPDRRNPILSPAYDFVSTIPYTRDDGAALNVNKRKRFDQFTLEELADMAERARVPKKLVLDTAKETVERFTHAWREHAAALPMYEAVRETIRGHLKRLPIWGHNIKAY